MKNINIVFMGTPVFAKNILEALVETGYNIVLVVSQEDKEKDRKGNIVMTPVKKYAIEQNLKVLQCHKIKDEYEQILKYKPDLIITCAYGQIIPEELINYPKYSAINVHGSLLPKYRGGAPIHHAIMDGETKTGITIMYMSKQMDAGDIISQKEIPIEEDDNLSSLYNKLSYLGRDLLLDTLPKIINKTNQRIKQDENKVTYAYNIKKEEEQLDFSKQALQVHNQIRGLSDIPGAYFTLNDKRIKVFASTITSKDREGEIGKIVDITKEGIYVNCKDKQISLTKIQIPGKKVCNIKEFVNGIYINDYKNKIIGKN